MNVISWGKGITLVILLFIVGIGYLVYRTTIVKSEMVTDNYYEKELKHEEVLQAERNALNLSALPKVELQTNQIVVDFPKEMMPTKILGDIVFYKPNKSADDKSYPISLSADNTQVINLSELAKGVYQIQIKWKQDEVPYYFQSDIYIPL